MSKATRPKHEQRAAERVSLHHQLVGELARLVGVGDQIARGRASMHREATNRAAELHAAREKLGERIGDGGADSLASRHNDVLLAHEVRHRAVAEALSARADDDDADDDAEGWLR